MMTNPQSEREAFEKMDVERLEQFLNETVTAMATATNLKPNEALDILEHVHVGMVGELSSTVKALCEEMETAKRVDSDKLSWSIEKAIEAISTATDLDTDDITSIFCKEPGASIADVSGRLHKESAYQRTRF